MRQFLSFAHSLGLKITTRLSPLLAPALVHARERFRVLVLEPAPGREVARRRIVGVGGAIGGDGLGVVELETEEVEIEVGQRPGDLAEVVGVGLNVEEKIAAGAGGVEVSVAGDPALDPLGRQGEDVAARPADALGCRRVLAGGGEGDRGCEVAAAL